MTDPSHADISSAPRRPRVLATKWRSLRTRLVAAFVFQIVAVVMAIGWLTFTESESSVGDVADQLRDELSQRVLQKVKSYVDVPFWINEMNADAFTTGHLSLDQHAEAARYFWKQMKIFETVAYISVGTASGKFFGIKRMDDGRLQLRIRTDTTGGALQRWELNARGEPVRLVYATPHYDPRVRPWYMRGKAAEKTIWTDIESYYSSPNELATGPVTPIMSGSDVLGVLSTDLQLSQLSGFMKTMTISKNGVAFILDTQGIVVASSTADRLTIDRDGKAEPVKAKRSPNDRVRGAANHLLASFDRFEAIKETQHLAYTLDGVRYFLTVVPFGGYRSLDWMVVIAVPENDFLEKIEKGRQLTLGLCLIALVIALLLAVGISRGITNPLLRLTGLARRLQSGDLTVEFETDSRDEIGTLTRTMNEMVQGLRDRDFIRDAFGRYLSPELAERFMQDRDSLQLGGHIQQVTILMSDLRGFTSLSERLGPERMVQLLNRYLGCMTDVIINYRGTIIEFIGDAILVVFGAPIRDVDDHERAVRCSIAMQRAMVAFNDEGREEGIPHLEMGIAVHTGFVVAGNIGSESHVKYGVVGEPVNLTARIESLNLGGQVLLSDDTYRLVSGVVVTAEPKVVRLKGVSGALKVYELLSMRDDPENPVPPRDPGVMVATEMPAEVFPIVGYEMAEVATQVTIVRLGLRYIDVVTGDALVPMAKVKLRIQLPSGAWTGDAYANVTDFPVEPLDTPSSGSLVRLGFTSLVDSDRLALEKVISDQGDS